MDTLSTPITFVLQLTELDLIKMLLPSAVAFGLGILITPLITNFMYKHRLWKKKVTDVSVDGTAAPITSKLRSENETNTPRMGGLVILTAAVLTTALFLTLSLLFDNQYLDKFNFVSREQTWLPIAAFIVGCLTGMVDDLATIGKIGFLNKYISGGLRLKYRIAIIAALASVIGWWFVAKQDVTVVHIPYWETINFGWFFILFFVILMVGMYSTSIIDGIDGLSGGIMSIVYATFGVISLLEQRYDVAAFCFVIVGATLAFLWFNIPPARFFMTETGIMGLTVTLAVIATITNTIALLPIICLSLITAPLSVIIQVTSKKTRGGKKVFKVSPIHNHFWALGWPHPKISMRYWIFTAITCVIGLVVFLTGGFI